MRAGPAGNGWFLAIVLWRTGLLQAAAIDAENFARRILSSEEEVSRAAERELEPLGREALGEVVKAMVPFLTVDDPEVRARASKALVSCHELSVPLLVHTLSRMKEARDRLTVVRVLAAISADHTLGVDAAPALLDLLSDPEEDLRDRAIQTLVNVRPHLPASAIPVLLKALKDASPEVRQQAGAALFNMDQGCREALPFLIPLLPGLRRDSHEEILANVLSCFRYAAPGSPEANGVVTPFLSHPSHDISGRAARVLAEIGPPLESAVLPLVKLCQAEFWREERWPENFAAKALGPAGVNALPLILKALKAARGNVYALQGLAQAVGYIGPAAKEALPDLAAMLDHGEPWVKFEAAWAIGQIGEKDDRVKQKLFRIFQDDVPFVRLQAVRTLVALGGSASTIFPALAAQVRVESDPEIKGAMVEMMWSLHATFPEVSPVLLELLQDLSPAVVEKAAIVLGAYGRTAALSVPSLTSLLHHRIESNRLAAAHALGTIGPEARRAVPDLVECLDAKPISVRVSAVCALMRIEGVKGNARQPVLVSLMEDEEIHSAPSRVLADAAEVLQDLNPERAASLAVPLLVEALQEGPPEWSDQVIMVLKKIGTPAALAAVKKYREKK